MTVKFGYHILIVDDVTEKIQVVMNILKEQNYQFSFATSGAEALALVDQQDFDLILLDIMMPGMNGFDVCKQIKSQPSLHDDVPIIFLTARTDIDSISQGFALGAVDYIVKPFHPEELIARVGNHLELSHARKLLEFHNITLQRKMEGKEKRIARELENYQKDIIRVLTELMEATSDETGKHIRRVAEVSRLLAQHCNSISDEETHIIYYAAPMHDIGKISLPHGLVHKPDKLTEAEYSTMRTHTQRAHDFLKHSDRLIMKAADVIAMQHHEKWDGTGYPKGLKGNEIHIYGRIVALADVFDALTHKRSYKDAWPLDEAVDYIQKLKGIHFDPELVDIFSEHIDEIAEIIES